MKISFIGHVSIDVNVIKNKEEVHYGGGVVHGAITAFRLNQQVEVITKCKPEDQVNFSKLFDSEIAAVFINASHSTSIKNVYPTDNPDDRKSYLLSAGDPFTDQDVSNICSKYVHINPLWAGEFPVHLFAGLRKNAKFLSADAQGFVRHVSDDTDHALINRDFAEKQQVLPLLDLFKVDSKEALILTGKTDIRPAAAAIRELGPKIVLLTHKGGVCVFDGKDFYESPFTSFTLEGRTGRGDTCTAAFLSALNQSDIKAATAFAAQVTSRKMQYRGPYRG